MNTSYKKQSLWSSLTAIASIVSAAILCIRLCYFGILSIEWAAIIMISVVVFAAIGNAASKLGISLVAIYLFTKFVSNGNEVQFQSLLGSILALLIALIGLYYIIKKMFRWF
jgi:uncharacterized membrane protein YccC